MGVGAPRRCNCYLERQRPAPTGMIARCVVAVVGREQSKPGPEGAVSGAERSKWEESSWSRIREKTPSNALLRYPLPSLWRRL